MSMLSHVNVSLAASVIVLALGALPGQAGAQGPAGVSILTLLPSAGTLEIGSETQGRLTSRDVLTTGGQRVQAYDLTGSAGDPLTVDVRSDDFDSYVFLVGPG